MLPFRRRPHPAHHMPGTLRPISWWWMLAGAGVVIAACWITTAWMLAQAGQVTPDGERAKARIDAVRTGLATGGGVAAGAALLLAFRRQHHAEATSASNDYDASEKRITELYTKAVEQLGSERAAVRLGGLYALERLAQNTADHRQVVVDVICGYLRMPYDPPDTTAHPPSGDSTPNAVYVPHAADARQPAGPADPREEHQVRLTAQRILTAHLRKPADDEAHRQFWDGISLDLTGATLLSLDFSRCVVGEVNFYGATFTGSTTFDQADFQGPAWFNRATFARVRFDGATFHRDAAFGRAVFDGPVSFGGIQTHDSATFEAAEFHGAPNFALSTFGRDVRFSKAVFGGGSRFHDVTFRGPANFEAATFAGAVKFDKAEFRDEAVFFKSVFRHRGYFREAVFRGYTTFQEGENSGRVDLTGAHATTGDWRLRWPPDWGMADEDGDIRLLIRRADVDELAGDVED